MSEDKSNSAAHPNCRLDSRPPFEPEPDPETTEEHDVVLKSKVPFKRKTLDLSIFTFDETSIEKSFKDT